MPSILIIGGARSGKSSHALALGESLGGHLVFIATAQRFDDEMIARIDRHQAERGDDWSTIETQVEIGSVIQSHNDAAATVVVDCLTLWLNNLMLCDHDLDVAFAALFGYVRDFRGNLIFVSNELGMGLTPNTPLGRRFRDAHGRMNRLAAEVCDQVLLMVAGIPLTIKG